MQLPENLIQRITSGLAIAGVVGLAGAALLIEPSKQGAQPSRKPAEQQVEQPAVPQGIGHALAPPQPEKPAQPLAQKPEPEPRPAVAKPKPAPAQAPVRHWDHCPGCGRG